MLGLLEELSPASSQTDPSPTFTVLRQRLRVICVILGVVSACSARRRRSIEASSPTNDAGAETALKLWVSDSIVSAVVKAYLQLFSRLSESSIGGQLDVANEFFG